MNFPSCIISQKIKQGQYLMLPVFMPIHRTIMSNNTTVNPCQHTVIANIREICALTLVSVLSYGLCPHNSKSRLDVLRPTQNFDQ